MRSFFTYHQIYQIYQIHVILFIIILFMVIYSYVIGLFNFISYESIVILSLIMINLHLYANLHLLDKKSKVCSTTIYKNNNYDIFRMTDEYNKI